MSLPIVLVNGEVYIETSNGLRKITPYEREICLNDEYWVKGEYNHD